MDCEYKSEQNERAAETLVQLSHGFGAEKYKPSRFNAHTDEPDGTLILYNSLTGRSIGVIGETAAYVRTLLSKQGFSGPLSAVGEYLFNEGYIVEESGDEIGKWDVTYSQEQFRSDILQLILLSSEECNFRCIYCSQEFKRGAMAPWVRTGVRKFVEERITKLRGLEITWFGGEPMLGYEVIEELAPFFRDLANHHGVAYESRMTTNAYLLSPERSRKMVEWGITSYQITIDGTALQHDSHRPLRRGGRTYQTIIDNIIAMRNLEYAFSIRLRVNFDKTNVDKLTPLFESLRDLVGSDPRYVLAFHPVGRWGGPHDQELDICGTKESFIHQRRLREEARSFGLSTEPIYDQLIPRPQNVCYAARPYSYIIGADGKVMKCTVALDTEPKNIVGKITEAGVLKLNLDRFAKWVKPYYVSDSVCRECFFVPVCQGASCPLPRVVGTERPCPPVKENIRLALNELLDEQRQEGRLVNIPTGAK